MELRRQEVLDYYLKTLTCQVGPFLNPPEHVFRLGQAFES
jgi:hypothetical protein